MIQGGGCTVHYSVCTVGCTLWVVIPLKFGEISTSVQCCFLWAECAGLCVSFLKDWKTDFEGLIICICVKLFLWFCYLISSYCVIDDVVKDL